MRSFYKIKFCVMNHGSFLFFEFDFKKNVIRLILY